MALIGEGQIHGEEDAISMRPYQASLRCHATGELLALDKKKFQNMFKECANGALEHARIKEKKYLERCRGYLDMNRQVLEESKTVALQGIKKELKVTADDFRKYEKIDRIACPEKKASFLDVMEQKMNENNNQFEAASQAKKKKSLSPDPEKSFVTKNSVTVGSPVASATTSLMFNKQDRQRGDKGRNSSVIKPNSHKNDLAATCES